MVLPHSSTQKYLFTLGGQFAAARGGQYDRLLQLQADYVFRILLQSFLFPLPKKEHRQGAKDVFERYLQIGDLGEVMIKDFLGHQNASIANTLPHPLPKAWRISQFEELQYAELYFSLFSK